MTIPILMFVVGSIMTTIEIFMPFSTNLIAFYHFCRIYYMCPWMLPEEFDLYAMTMIMSNVVVRMIMEKDSTMMTICEIASALVLVMTCVGRKKFMNVSSEFCAMLLAYAFFVIYVIPSIDDRHLSLIPWAVYVFTRAEEIMGGEAKFVHIAPIAIFVAATLNASGSDPQQYSLVLAYFMLSIIGVVWPRE